MSVSDVHGTSRIDGLRRGIREISASESGANRGWYCLAAASDVEAGQNYKALRSTVPWLKKMPSQYIREHCYLTTQPIEEPDNPQHLIDLFNMIDAENMILYSSDYPHWDFDSPDMILRRLKPEAKRKIFYENAKSLYNL